MKQQLLEVLKVLGGGLLFGVTFFFCLYWFLKICGMAFGV